MKPFRRTLVISVMGTAAIMAPLAAQSGPDPLFLERFERLNKALEKIPLDMRMDLDLDLDGVTMALSHPLFGLAFQQPDRERELERARQAAERARESTERARDAAERVRDAESRNNDYYRAGAEALDNRNYEKAIKYFDRVIENKSPRADGAYYWKAYALNKMGKRDEALAALAEVPKQFPQSRWLNDAKALQVEVQQVTGAGVSPESQTDEELKLYAINALVDSDPERAIPLLEKLLNDSKNPPRLKERALFVLARSRSDKAQEIVGRYAKGGSNPDLQLRAVEYLGQFRSKESQKTLADAYASVNDVNVKRAILRSFMMSRDTEHLFNAAKSESNADLRRDAIHQLGLMRAQGELAQLYATETNFDLKDAIIQALFLSQDTDKLLEIAKNEKDSRLRLAAIHRMGLIRRDKSPDALASLYAPESDKTVKAEILQALWLQGSAKQIADLARKETDPELKKMAVQKLSMMKSKDATDFLMELLNK